MSKAFDVVFGQKYQSNGEEKTKWINCGSVIRTQKGGLCMKIDVIPVGFDGSKGLWFNLFEPKPRDGAPAQSSSQEAPPADDGAVPF